MTQPTEIDVTLSKIEESVQAQQAINAEHAEQPS